MNYLTSEQITAICKEFPWNMVATVKTLRYYLPLELKESVQFLRAFSTAYDLRKYLEENYLNPSVEVKKCPLCG